MNEFKIGDKVKCISSDKLDQLIVGEIYTISSADYPDVCCVQEIPKVLHFAKRFIPVGE